MSDSNNFFQAFSLIKSQEDRENYFSVAGTKRKLLTLNFYYALKMKETTETLECIVNENMDEYAEVVDNKSPGSVNNYAEKVLTVLSNFQNEERKYWKSHLQDCDVKKYLKPLSCSNNINCKNSELLKNDFNFMKLAFQQYDELETVKNEELPPKNIVTHTVSGPPKNNILVGYNNVQKAKSVNEDNQNVSKGKDSCFFRTARDELQIQNAKKYGANYANDKHPQTTIKKSLGTRKNGVYGKFQPPLRSNESKENESKMEVDEVVDERLKNIDPAMIEIIKNEIMDSGCKITWDDIAGLQLAKTTIQEIVVWPMLRPDIFTGLRRPPKGILLFGPPGTGKTLIGKCIASQSNSTFFSISASSLTSKWVGDGEKMVRTLFAVAKVYQPSVVFIDEIDSLLTQRSDSDHESSRRIKTEFLVQLDGAGTGDEDRILIIGATNRPQELDEAARRRLVKRLYIPLPDEEARKHIIENLISSERHCLTNSEIQKVASLTKGYSGADVKNLCQEASLGPIRSIAPSMIQSIDPRDVRPLNFEDFESALCRIKSSVSEKDLDIYLAWDKQYGCGSSINATS